MKPLIPFIFLLLTACSSWLPGETSVSVSAQAGEFKSEQSVENITVDVRKDISPLFHVMAEVESNRSKAGPVDDRLHSQIDGDKWRMGIGLHLKADQSIRREGFNTTLFANDEGYKGDANFKFLITESTFGVLGGIEHSNLFDADRSTTKTRAGMFKRYPFGDIEVSLSHGNNTKEFTQDMAGIRLIKEF